MGESVVFTYLGASFVLSMMRPPKAMVVPEVSLMGNMSLALNGS